MKCKLCNQDEKLCDSHIIPEAFYKTINDQKYRSVPISMDKEKLQFVQNGISEKLLCSNCESKLSKWETTLINDLKDIGNLKSKFLDISMPRETLIEVKNIRYENFKLSLLSILWRLSISSNKLFKSYKLGPYGEKLRHIIHTEKCPDYKTYMITMCQYRIKGKFHSDLILGFPPTRYENQYVLQKFIIWGHMFMFIVNDKKSPHIMNEMVLKENGEIIFGVADATELMGLKSVISRISDKDVTNMMNRLTI